MSEFGLSATYLLWLTVGCPVQSHYTHPASSLFESGEKCSLGEHQISLGLQCSVVVEACPRVLFVMR